ncbi:MAG TPA: MopE-related protein, partial [Myxococcota bacterium]|nr:MopE-related protein [Myxococcota bacterium]
QTWYRDADADNYGASASSTSACAQPVGYVSNATDCNDASAAIYPGATEICDSLDNDCDGQTDEGLSQTWYRDADADNYGASASSTSACAQPVGYVANATDCNDASSAVNPGATEICDSLDNNCNGTTDEGCGSRILTGEFLSSDYDTKIYGDSQNDYFGSAVAGGDFNGDGLVDIAVGAPDDEYSTNSNLGVVYLYNGAMASGVQLCTDQDDALLYSNSSGSYPDFGEFMWTLPDYSGDGRPELAVGSNQNYYNQIAVFTAGPYSGALSLATRTTSYTCSDISGSGNFSSTVGNGVACGYVSSGTAAGVVYIYGYGSSVPVATLNPEAGAKLTGYGLDVEQDIDGDGVNDAVVGAPQANTGGAAYIVMGPVNGSFNLANYDLKIQGPSSAGSIAERVLVAELDGDGRMDIVISDHNYNYGSRSSAGAFRVVYSPDFEGANR